MPVTVGGAAVTAKGALHAVASQSRLPSMGHQQTGALQPEAAGTLGVSAVLLAVWPPSGRVCMPVSEMRPLLTSEIRSSPVDTAGSIVQETVRVEPEGQLPAVVWALTMIGGAARVTSMPVVVSPTFATTSVALATSGLFWYHCGA